LRESPFIGGFRVETVYAYKSTERRGGGCYSKLPTDLARLSLYWQILSRDVYADKSTERRGGGCYSKSSADLAILSLYWRIPRRDCLRMIKAQKEDEEDATAKRKALLHLTSESRLE
jgi:hypothetical protein